MLQVELSRLQEPLGHIRDGINKETHEVDGEEWEHMLKDMAGSIARTVRGVMV